MERNIHALHYIDRVVQHCPCDEMLALVLERRLIFENAACRLGKGAHFVLERVNRFLRRHYTNTAMGDIS